MSNSSESYGEPIEGSQGEQQRASDSKESKGTSETAYSYALQQQWTPAPVVMIPSHLATQYAQQEQQFAGEVPLARHRTLTRQKSLTRPGRSNGLAMHKRSMLGSEDPHDRWTPWKVYVYAITCCCPGVLLSKFGKMDLPDRQRAWREKVALCSIVLFMCGCLAFITFGLQTAVCRPENFAFTTKEVKGFGPNNRPAHMIIFGNVYDMNSYMSTHNCILWLIQRCQLFLWIAQKHVRLSNQPA
jgi:hypothetical protein